MKEYIFPYFISYGKGDSVSCDLKYELSEKNAKRLEKSSQYGGRFRLNEDEEIDDIYCKVYNAVMRAEKISLMEHPEIVRDWFNLPEKFVVDCKTLDKYIDEYLDEIKIGINYPEHLQFLEQTRKYKSQTVIESVILNRVEAEENTKAIWGRKEIIYVDDGETLFYVPTNFAGKLIIPGSVRRIERFALNNRKRITEVVIENGLEEIPDSTFDGCESLKYVSVPGSVKRIGFNAFTKCSRLSVVDLSEGLEEIHNTAFRFCFDLEELVLPMSLPVISGHINGYLNGIKKVVFKGMMTSVDNIRGSDWSRTTIYALPGSASEAFARGNGIKLVYLTET